jgi:hypothetical protein
VKNKLFLLKDYAGAGVGESLEVADPFGESAESYHRCRMEIQESLLGVLSKIKEKLGRSS